MTHHASSLDVHEVARAIDFDLIMWPGNCFAVASKIVQAGLIQGNAVYGHYLGPVAPGTLFDGKPIIRHGWIKTPDGSLYDPTRFVFEGVPAYICKVPARNIHEYDEGGNLLRMMQTPPPPEHDASQPQTAVPDEAQDLFSRLLQRPERATSITTDEAVWLANLSTLELMDDAAPLYSALIAMNCKAYIPFDNLQSTINSSAKPLHSNTSKHI